MYGRSSQASLDRRFVGGKRIRVCPDDDDGVPEGTDHPRISQSRYLRSLGLFYHDDKRQTLVVRQCSHQFIGLFPYRFSVRGYHIL